MKRTIIISLSIVVILALTALPRAVEANLIITGTITENSVPITLDGNGHLDATTGLFDYTIAYSQAPFDLAALQTLAPWGKKPAVSDVFALANNDLTINFSASNQFGDSINATIAMTGTTLITMNIVGTATTDLGPLPFTSGSIPILTHEFEFANPTTPGIISFVGMQPIPTTGGTDNWNYSGTYVLNGNPSGVIPQTLELFGDYTMNIDTATLSGIMTVQAVPEPSSLLLLGSGIVSLLGYACYRRRTVAA